MVHQYFDIAYFNVLITIISCDKKLFLKIIFSLLFQPTTMAYLLIYFLLFRSFSFPLKYKNHWNGYTLFRYTLPNSWLFLHNLIQGTHCISSFAPLLFMVGKTLYGPFAIPHYWFLNFSMVSTWEIEKKTRISDYESWTYDTHFLLECSF